MWMDLSTESTMNPYSVNDSKIYGDSNGWNEAGNGAFKLAIKTRLKADDDAKCRANLVEWLNILFPHLRLPSEASEEKLRSCLNDGTVLCAILSNLCPGSLDESQGHHFDEVKRFVSALDEMGLPAFEPSDLQQGSMLAVVNSLLAVKGHFCSDLGGDNSPAKYGSQLRKKWKLPEVLNVEGINGTQGDRALYGSLSPKTIEERKRSSPGSKFQHALRSPVMAEPSAALSHHVGHKFHEVFQLKQGRYSDLPPAKISEMLKSTSLDNAPTQSLLGVVNGILDESMDKKSGEIPYRVACLLRKVMQEVERRISTQAEHIREQSNLIKARDAKYQSRIRVLETLAIGTCEETQSVMNQLQQIKTEKTKVEETKKIGEQDTIRLRKEKENNDIEILDLKKEIEITKQRYEERCRKLGTQATETKMELEKRLKEAEILLVESSKKNKELEAFSESKVQRWKKKEHAYQNCLGSQFQALGELRVTSSSIKKEILNTQKSWQEEFNDLGKKLKGLADAAQNYHKVLAENIKLYNEVQDLKGNIRVYCRVRPFLSSLATKQSTIEYIGENGELLVANPLKQEKGQRLFKFNKVFGPTASQVDVFLDTQPLIRSVLDGYNVCIFAYGQTGSGKTYTMTGPDGASEENWGVNYRALHDLFHISQNRKSTFTYEVGVQMVEIYNEQVRDLLSNDGSQKRLGIWNSSQPNGLAVPDASMYGVQSTADVLELMQIGHMNRAVGATALNVRSSRSHSILTVHVRGVDLETGSSSRGSLHLVDLAGSERVDRSEATGDRLKEAQHINKSLSALGDVIFALAQKSSYIPYRNSKLTQVLQSSLGGQAKTLMFVQLNPDVDSYSETVSTLKFAERVSGVELGAARSNKEGKDVRDLIEQVASLKDIIGKKDEEIEQLQFLKDSRSASTNVRGEKRGTSSQRHSSSSPNRPPIGGGPANRSPRLSGGTVTVPSNKAASDMDNSSEYSDKHSEASSQQSMEDFSQKKLVGQPKLVGAQASQNSTADERYGFGNADSERLSDISDGGLSMGTDTDGSTCSGDSSLLSEGVKPAESSNKFRARVPRPPPKVGQIAPGRQASKDSLKASSAKESMKVLPTRNLPKVPATKSSSIRKTSMSPVIGSSAKSSKRWQ